MKKTLKKSGLTLIEVIISLAILSIAVIPLGNLALTSVKVEKDSASKLNANALSQQIMEYIKEPNVMLNNIGTTLKSGNLSLTDFNNDSIKDILLDTSTEKKEDFFFYEAHGKDCYVKVRIAPVYYNAEYVVPKDEETSIWKSTSFQHRIKIVKDGNSLELYNVNGTTESFKANLNADAASTILNITNIGTSFSYNIYQDGVLEVTDIKQNLEGKEPCFNLQIQENCPSIIVNIENQDEVSSLKIFVNELVGVDKNEYTPNYKVYSKGKVGVYTKMTKENKNFSDVRKIYKVEVKIYSYKNGVKTLLQNLTDYKYVEVN